MFLTRRTQQTVDQTTAQSGVDTEHKTQFHVDVFQTDDMVVVYGQVPGADLSQVQVAIEGDADIVIIEGLTTRPHDIAFPGKKKPNGSFVAEECVWGEFYRRIILPERVDVAQADAKLKHGALVLLLPLLPATETEAVRVPVELAETNKS